MRNVLMLTAMLGTLLGAGSVTMRGGRRAEGQVKLEDGAVWVQSPGAAPVRVRMEDARAVVIQPSPRAVAVVADGKSPLPSGWNAQDIGDVHRPGAASCSVRGIFAISASGYGAWGPSDSFHYAYTALDGDGQIIARLAKVDSSHGAMAAGVMFRESLASDSLMAGATIQPSGEVRMSRRPLVEPPSFKRPEDVSPRQWVRIARKGDVFSAYSSTNGVYWDLVESKTIKMPSHLLAGLAAWTTSNTSLGHVWFDSVMVIPGTPGATFFNTGDRLMQGVVLRDGSILAGAIRAMDETSVRIVRDGREMPIPRDIIAMVVFNPIPANRDKIRGQRGAWLVNGDFVDGRVGELVERDLGWGRKSPPQVVIKSVLLGTQYFKAATQVMAIALADVSPRPAAYLVCAADGSLWRANKVQLTRAGVLADGTAIPDVVEITAVSGAFAAN